MHVESSSFENVDIMANPASPAISYPFHTESCCPNDHRMPWSIRMLRSFLNEVAVIVEQHQISSSAATWKLCETSSPDLKLLYGKNKWSEYILACSLFTYSVYRFCEYDSVFCPQKADLELLHAFLLQVRMHTMCTVSPPKVIHSILVRLCYTGWLRRVWQSKTRHGVGKKDLLPWVRIMPQSWHPAPSRKQANLRSLRRHCALYRFVNNFVCINNANWKLTLTQLVSFHLG